MPSGEANPLAKLGEARVVLLSGSEEGLKAADKNKIVVAPPFAVYGQMVVRMLDSMARHHTVFSNVSHVDPQLVTLSNLDQRMAELKAVRAGQKIIPVISAEPLK